MDLDRFGEQTIDVADFEIEVSDDTFPSQFKLEFYYKEEPEMGGPGQNEVKFVWDPKDYNNSDIQFSGNQKKLKQFFWQSHMYIRPILTMDHI